ncbi:MAG: NfeD family protein [Bacteroidota bacterium]|jgi:membrane protein implicated in regulation of membrane protease activity|nr:NfeD family protein [Flavisolibacter sp.]MDQ3552726.1 NfeD family protein [Bacteroidota bacterium]
MDDFSNPAVIWFIAGFILFILEFALPGFILFFFGVGAWIVALLAMVFDIPINVQLLIFLGASIVTILLFRKSMQKIILVKKKSSEIEDEFIGKTARSETAITPAKNGKVYFKGTSWDAASEDVIGPDENVTIIGNESILLIVKTTKTT